MPWTSSVWLAEFHLFMILVPMHQIVTPAIIDCLSKVKISRCYELVVGLFGSVFFDYTMANGD